MAIDTSIYTFIKTAIQNDISRIRDQIGDIFRVHQSELTANGMASETELLRGLIDYLSQDINTLTKSGENVFETIKVIGNIDSQIDNTKNKLLLLSDVKPPLVPTILPNLNNAFNILKGWLKNLASHLWQMLSLASSFKEWSIKGGVDVAIFGFSSNVELELNFGYPSADQPICT